MEDEWYQKIMISVQGALLGKITPSIRAVVVGWSGDNLVKVKFVVDQTPTQLHNDLLADATGEILADYPNIEIDAKCERSDAAPKDWIIGYKSLAYLRYEG